MSHFDDPYYNNFFNLTFQRYLPPTGQRALDMGCATGVLSRRLAKMGYNVVGVDISETLIDIAKQQSQREGVLVQYYAYDAENMPFEDGAFDAVLAFNILHHFPEIKGIACEILRVCRPGGHIFTFDPNRLNPHAFLCQERVSPVRYDRFTINERALHPKEFSCFNQRNIKINYLSVELKSSSASKLYHRIYGFIERSIRSPYKRILAFFLFNFAHVMTLFLPEKFKGSVLLGVIQKDEY